MSFYMFKDSEEAILGYFLLRIFGSVPFQVREDYY
jgi:hypothetical protein